MGRIIISLVGLTICFIIARAGVSARRWPAKVDLGVSMPWSTINHLATYDGSTLPADKNHGALVSVNLMASVNL